MSCFRRLQPRSKYSAWLQLGAGLLLIWCLVFVVAPWLARWTPIRTMHAHIHQRDIDATALFYTDLDEFRDAEQAVRHALTYSK